jgi:DNA processing protein
MDRATLIAYSMKYAGDPYRIAKAIQSAEEIELPAALPLCVCLLDEKYPMIFRQLRKPPFVIYYHGNLSLLNRDTIGIVGSREASPDAILQTSRITKVLAKKYVVVSGMARGIDTAAHLAALEEGDSVAILGSGIDFPYPMQNIDLYENLKLNGLVISEYPGRTQPLKHHFPYRNRMIAASSKGIVVTQAVCKSGTMLTVKEALELGRDVYCLPYPYNSKEGAGCNLLIQQGATILTNDEDLDII